MSSKNTVSNCLSATAVYTTGGKSYRPLKSADGYRASGRAMVYQHKDQGSQTASCEEFDLNGFTAAHRTLPLPTHVKLTNTSNGQAVVVKVNDRGPMSGDSLLVVTPAVANLLGGGASFPVRIEAIAGSRSGQADASESAAKPVAVKEQSSPAAHVSRPVDRSGANRHYIIVGTYNSRDQALDKFIRLSSIGLANAAMESRTIKGRMFHMVRLGPYYEQDKIDNAKDRLINDGLVEFKVVRD